MDIASVPEMNTDKQLPISLENNADKQLGICPVTDEDHFADLIRRIEIDPFSLELT